MLPSLGRLALLPAAATRQRRHKETPTDAPKRPFSDITKAELKENSKALQAAQDVYDELSAYAASAHRESVTALSLTKQRSSEATVRAARKHAETAQEALAIVTRLANQLQQLAAEAGASEEVKALAIRALERADEARGAAEAAAEAAEDLQKRAPPPPAGQSHNPLYAPPSNSVILNDDGAKLDSDGNISRHNASFDDDAKTERYVIAYWEIEPFTDTEMEAYRKHGAEEDKEVKMDDGAFAFDEVLVEEEEEEEEEANALDGDKASTEDDLYGEEEESDGSESEDPDKDGKVANDARNELLRLANMRYWQVLCWLDKLQKGGIVLDQLGLRLQEGDLPGIENKVRAACVQWAREGGGHEGSGKVNPKGSPVIWAILLFLQTLAERNTPPRVVVQEKEYVEQRRQTKTTTKKGGKSEELVDRSQRYTASLFYTLKELHKYLENFKGDRCRDRAPQNISATKVRGEHATTQARQVDLVKVHKLRHDSLGPGDAANVKADFLHNLLRRAEVAAQAERSRQGVLAAARQEAAKQARVEWAKNKDPNRVEEDVAVQQAQEQAEEQAAEAASKAARKEAERAWKTATGLCQPVRELKPPEVAPLQKSKLQTRHNQELDRTPVPVQPFTTPWNINRTPRGPREPANAPPKPGSGSGGGSGGGGGGVVDLDMEKKAKDDAFERYKMLEAAEARRNANSKSYATWRSDRAAAAAARAKLAKKEAAAKAKADAKENAAKAKADAKENAAKANAKAKAKKQASTKANKTRTVANAASKKTERLKKAAMAADTKADNAQGLARPILRAAAQNANAEAEQAAKEAAAKEAAAKEAEAAEAAAAAALDAAEREDLIATQDAEKATKQAVAADVDVDDDEDLDGGTVP